MAFAMHLFLTSIHAAPWPFRFFGLAGGRVGYVAHPRGATYLLPELRDWALAAAAVHEAAAAAAGGGGGAA